MATVLGIFDEYYEAEKKRKHADVEYPPASSLVSVQPDPSYWLMTMKVCESRLAEIAARTWPDPRAWYNGNAYTSPEPEYTAPEPAYRGLGADGTEGSAGAFDLDLLQMNLEASKWTGVLSTGVTYHDQNPLYHLKDYRTYDGHYKYERHDYQGGLAPRGPLYEPTEEQCRLWQVRDRMLQTEKARVKAMHASALHSIMQHYGKSLTTDSDRVWARYEEPEDWNY